MLIMEPRAFEIEMDTGALRPAERVIRRTLREMRALFADQDAVERILATDGDRLIYEVCLAGIEEAAGQIPYSTTVIQPGRVGDEFHMTKGHFHVLRDRAEIYLGLAGEGHLILQTEDGTARSLSMRPGTVGYVPPHWGHRTANSGSVPFAFLAAWPGEAGHDYGTVEERGFAQILVSRDGRPTLIANPKHV